MFSNYNWNEAFGNFMKSLSVMGFGMLGIFLVIGVIFLFVLLLSRLPDKEEKE